MSSTAPPEPPPGPPPTLGRTAATGRGFFGLAAGSVTCAAATFALDALPWAAVERIIGSDSAVAVIAVPLAAGFAAYLGGAVLLLGLWRHPFRSRRHGVGGGLLALCLLLFAMQSIAFAAAVFHAPKAVRSQLVAKSYGYVLDTDVARKRVRLHGIIGTGLLGRLQAIERELGAILVLEITSEGGLIGEAFDVAAFLEQRAITVVARKMCDSACVFIAIASPQSYADHGLSFGLHSAASLVDADDEVTRYSTREAQSLTRAFLLAHKVPARIVRQAARTAADDMLYVPAARLFEAGAIRGLMDGEVVVREVPRP